MRLPALSIAIALDLILMAALYFHEDRSLKGTPPLAPLHAIEIPSPLQITVRCPTQSDHFKTDGWSSASDPQPKAVVLVLIKNISDRNIVLPHFTYWRPGITFQTRSPFASNPKFFPALIGQLDWVILKPGNSITAYDDVGNYLTFHASGTYILDYSVVVDYCDYQRALDSPTYFVDSHIPVTYSHDVAVSETEAELEKSNPEAHFTASTIGRLDLPIAVDQISSK